MRVCLVSLDYKPYRSSGLTIYAEDLARGLFELGINVTVIAGRRQQLPAHHQISGIEIYRVPVFPLDWISYCWRAANLIYYLEQNNHFDLVHFLDIHFAYAYQHKFIASIWQSFRQRLTAQNGHPCHTSRLDLHRRELYYQLARFFFEKPSLLRAGHLIASCKSTLKEFVDNYNVAPHHIDLVPQGIDTNLFQPMQTNKVRQQLGLNGYRIILFIGFITPRKGMDYLAHALHLLPKDVHLLIGGRWAPGCRERFLKIVGTARSRVHELGFISDEERPLYYSLADVYVSPSLLEGLGITSIEAQACGTPAVVTSASSGPEEVGNAGIIVPPCDSHALAEAITILLENSDLRKLLSNRGRERIKRKFSYKLMAELTLKTYQIFLMN
jgi:glycosyltransferase involved in cell wall biosynthesis